MSDIKEYIEKIVDEGTNEDMHKLSNMLENTIEDLKQFDDQCYEQYKMELYKIAYGNTLNKSMAQNIVSNMRPYGQRWSIEETKSVQNDFGVVDINPIDFYIVLNSAYNDYYNIFNENLDMYVKFTIDFINDEDARKDKTFLYFTTIPY